MNPGLIFRAAGPGGLQGARKKLGPGLWSLPASSPGWPGAMLHPLPTWLPECTGLRVDLHIMVSWPVSSMLYHLLCTLYWNYIHSLMWLVKASNVCIIKSLKRYANFLLLHFRIIWDLWDVILWNVRRIAWGQRLMLTESQLDGVNTSF